MTDPQSTGPEPVGHDKPIDPKSFNLPQRTILSEHSNDRLGLALIALMREVWIVKDRMMMLEAVIEQQGISVTEAIESFEPDEAFSKVLEAEGDAFIHAVTDILSTD